MRLRCRPNWRSRGGALRRYRRRLCAADVPAAGFRMIDKTVRSVAEALADVQDGAVVLVGGFGAVGHPMLLIEGLVERGVRDLTIVCNNAGWGNVGLPKLMELGRVRRIVCSFPRTSDVFSRLFAAGKLELEIVPQGTLAE